MSDVVLLFLGRQSYIGEVAMKYELSIFHPILQSKNIRCFSEDIGKGPGGHEAIVLCKKVEQCC
jgi:hypothetical protein